MNQVICLVIGMIGGILIGVIIGSEMNKPTESDCDGCDCCSEKKQYTEEQINQWMKDRAGENPLAK